MEFYIADHPGIRKSCLAKITDLITSSITSGCYPGAVVLVLHQDQTVYRGVFGHRMLAPEIKPMQWDTLFDWASLTKVVVTTTAIMQLIEGGQLHLDLPAADYWPDFNGKDKEKITIKQLLTHTSGLPAVLSSWQAPDNPAAAFQLGLTKILETDLIAPSGKEIIYSDVNFLILGYIVELITQQKLADYAQKNIFEPLNMSSTGFLPAMALREQIAPTLSPDNQFKWGSVNDPTTERMGGVTGVAGLFGNAQDLGTFAQCLLNQGRISNDRYLLSPLSISQMTMPQTPLEISEKRGLGWDIDSRFSFRGSLLPLGSYGHSGWTGTSLWIDPFSKTVIIILTNRTHPAPAKKNQLIVDRRAVSNIVAGSLNTRDQDRGMTS